ncbi:hypothetical protein PISMIDRAFT_679604 [Pisolithus microcarpus 441]|uniref:Uncharacterized protein n=1 Tax=Pisolithus microcarpus 441 TaxID=765257 RepID=A0A0C9YE74_9AGAM|nr:hypothetical protein PISMIDRAFT_679604 [Pisolithus microcarpus 441]
MTTFARVYVRLERLSRRHLIHSWMMIRLTCSGSYLMRGQGYRNISYGLLPELRSKTSGHIYLLRGHHPTIPTILVEHISPVQQTLDTRNDTSMFNL